MTQQSGKTLFLLFCFITGETSLYHNNRGKHFFFYFVSSRGKLHYITTIGENNHFLLQFSLNGANTNFSTLVHNIVDTNFFQTAETLIFDTVHTNYFLGCGVDTLATFASLARRSSCR